MKCDRLSLNAVHFGFGVSEKLENRDRMGLLPLFLGGFVPGFPGMASFGFSPLFVSGF